MNKLSELITELIFIKGVFDASLYYANKNEEKMSVKMLESGTTLMEHYIAEFDIAFENAWKQTIGSMDNSNTFE